MFTPLLLCVYIKRGVEMATPSAGQGRRQAVLWLDGLNVLAKVE